MSPPFPSEKDPMKMRIWELERRASLSEEMGEERTLEGITTVIFNDLISLGAIQSACILRPRFIPVRTGSARNGEIQDATTIYKQELVVEIASTDSQSLIGKRIPWGVGVTGRAAKSNQPRTCDNIADAGEGEYLSTPARQSIGSELAVPLFGRGRLLGILEVQSNQTYAFTTHLKGFIGQQGGVLARHLIGVEQNEHCELTGVYTGSVFRRLAELEMASALRKQENLSFVELDLDLFKRVNDYCGHHEGDNVLRRFGQVLRQTSRQSDFLVRTGGDEFYIIMPYTNYTDAENVASRLRETVSEQIILDYPLLREALNLSENPRLTFSYGVASLCYALNEVAEQERGPFLEPTSDNVSMLFDKVYHHADEQMYRMKNGNSA